MSRKFGPVERRIQKAMGRITKEALESEARMAKKVVDRAKELVPVVTGELRDSGEAEGSIAKFTAKYALWIHELPTSTGYKFLQRAVDQITAEEWADDMSDAELLANVFEL